MASLTRPIPSLLLEIAIALTLSTTSNPTTHAQQDFRYTTALNILAHDSHTYHLGFETGDINNAWQWGSVGLGMSKYDTSPQQTSQDNCKSPTEIPRLSTVTDPHIEGKNSLQERKRRTCFRPAF